MRAVVYWLTYSLTIGYTVINTCGDTSCAAEPDLDRATGERYADRRLDLPEFPFVTRARWRGLDLTLRVYGAYQEAHRTESRAPAVEAGLTSPDAYLVVGPQRWHDSLTILIRGQRALGRYTRWLSMEDIDIVYAHVADPADRLKAALHDAYAAGVGWVLLAGDARHVPVRYASDTQSDETLSIDQLQICDLYFGEFDGRWDLDGDGIYGEPVDDSADLAAEILIGRLPVTTAAEAAAWSRKWDRYVFARGDTRYLSGALGLCSDQMRDFEAGAGQAAVIARRWPAAFNHDSVTLLEWPTGAAEQPERPTASDIVARWSDGWGIVHIYAHGRWDGFALKTSTYNAWPKSYLLTDPAAVSPHDWLGRTAGPAGVVYSVACNQAAFDQEDAFGVAPGQRCVATQLLGQPDGGAVAFVGYSRWGWVYSSYRVAESFWTAVFDSGYTAGVALQHAKLQHPYLLDVAYGHNLYGDPSLHIWQGQPPSLDAVIPEWIASDERELEIRVTSPGPYTDTRVTLLDAASELLSARQVDETGLCRLSLTAAAGAELLVTVFSPGWAPRQQIVRVGVESSVTDEHGAAVAALVPSPNPFNASTRLTWTRSVSDRSLEIYNTLGHRVRQVGLTGGTGPGSWTWNGRDDRGRALPSGVYFARLRRAASAVTQRLLMLQ